MKRCLHCMNEYPDEYGSSCPSCGYMEGTTQNGGIYLQPGSILQARYIVGTVLKERDTDIFYIGWDALFDRKVQIQEYFPRYCATRSGKPELSIYDNKQEMYQDGLELFYQQSRQLIRLYKEEDVITYHACFKENGTVYAIMDYSQDITLNERLENHIFRVNEAEDCLDDAMDAVLKAHQIGVYHGQIGPDSFWEKPGGGLILKDFGASRYISGEPGIVDYGSAGTHTDVYGLAKLFCQLVTGKEIEDGEKLEGELMRKQISLKKPVVEALKRALLHQTRTIDTFQKELWGRRKVPKSRKKNKNHGSVALPRWVMAAAALVMAGLLIFTGLVATGKIDLQMQLGESRLARGEVRMPNLINMDRDDAKSLLKKKGLELNEGKMDYSEEIAENMISFQNVKEGMKVKKGSQVTVNISLGKEKGVFPQVIGKSREEALELLKEARFVNIKENESQEEGIFDAVLSVSEEQGKNVELSKEIILTICKNETAQNGDATVQVEVPDVAGKEKDAAEAALKEAGFSVNWVEENSDQPEGTILGQEPAAKETANKDSFVTVRISIGPEKLYMVNVELKTQEDAEKIITDLGLEIGEVKKDYSDTVESGKVISQSVAKDTEVKPGDKVDLVISIGPKEKKTQKEEPTSAKPQKPKQTQPQPSALPPAEPANPTTPAENNPPAPVEGTNAPDGKNTTNGVSGSGGMGGNSLGNGGQGQGQGAGGSSAGKGGASGQGGAPVETVAPTQTPAPTSETTPAPTPAPTSPPTPAPTPPPTQPPVQPPPPVEVEANPMVDLPF